MANVGKCLLFYLKYPAEMERLYEATERKLEELPNSDRVLEKIDLIGDAACREAADLLEICAPPIEEHFRKISIVQRTRNNLAKMWELRFQVAGTKGTSRGFQIGVSLEPRRAALVPWVWCRGGRAAEDHIIHILGRGTNAAKLDWDSGAVGLAEIKISIPERLEEAVTCDSLVAEVQQVFARFTAQHIKEIAGLSRDREEA